MDEYGLRLVLRKSGEEQFQANGASVGVSVLDFWQWSSSDLLSNTLRGRLAEFLVASALKVAATTRVEWDAIDVISPNGTKVEVKSSAYLQSWKSKPSTIRFDIQRRLAFAWETNQLVAEDPLRSADVYVFCLLDHQNPETVDPTNLSQWRFYVIATKELDAKLGSQKSLSLTRLLSLNPTESDYFNLSAAVELAVVKTDSDSGMIMSPLPDPSLR
jgi:hypothetical protein